MGGSSPLEAILPYRLGLFHVSKPQECFFKLSGPRLLGGCHLMSFQMMFINSEKLDKIKQEMHYEMKQ